MNKILVILIFLCLSAQLSAQNSFIYSEIEDSTFDSSLFNIEYRNTKTLIFEDKLYKCFSTCSGEWGGTVYFQNKLNGSNHAAAASCAVSVNVLSGRYYVTTMASHMHYSMRILCIENPEIMLPFDVSYKRNSNGKVIPISSGESETKSTQGTKKIIDTSDIYALCSFTYQNELYSIVSDDSSMYVAKVQNAQLIKFQNLASMAITSYRRNPLQFRSGHILVPASRGEEKCYLDIFENKITLVRFKSGL